MKEMRYSILILLVLTSCVSIYNTYELSVDKLHTTNRDLRLNLKGYYYNTDFGGITPMLLYSNGYMHEIFTYKMDNKEFEKSKISASNYFYPKEKKYGIWGWGIWWIEGDSIFIEQYCNRAGNYDLRYRKGLVLNDTTFVITSDFSDFQLPKLRPEHREYRFKYYMPKPDSSNYLQINIEKFGRKNYR